MKHYRLLALSLVVVFITTSVQPQSSAPRRQNRPSHVQQSTDDSQVSPEAREKLRKLAAKKKTYQVGYSPVMDRKEAQLSGIEIPKDEPQRALLKRAENQRRWNEYLNG